MRKGTVLKPIPQVTNMRLPSAPYFAGAQPSATIASSSVSAR